MAAEGFDTTRSLPTPGFAGDDGSAPPALLAALAGGDEHAVVAALLTSRLLVPVVAVLGQVEVGADGLPRDKRADMAVVTVRSPSGRVALPAFSSTASLVAWNAEARPVAVAGVLAARAAYDEGADTLLVDPAGPTRVVLAGALLRALAEGRLPVPPFEDPDVRAAVGAAAAAAGLGSDQVQLEAGEGVDLVVRVTVASDVPGEDAAAAAQALGAALAADPLVGGRLERGLDLALERGQDIDPGSVALRDDAPGT